MMNRTLYLSAYWGDVPETNIERSGSFNEMSHGGPSTWILSYVPFDPNVASLWRTIYRNKKYAYVFDRYNYQMDNKTFFNLLEKEADVIVDELRGGEVVVVQTDHLFDEWNDACDLWHDLDSDDLGGTLSLIKFELN
jgi:hypothetical protein